MYKSNQITNKIFKYIYLCPNMFKFIKMKKYVQLINKMYLENVSKYSKVKIINIGYYVLTPLYNDKLNK